MNDVKLHYENFLGEIYSWMSGSFETRINEFNIFLDENKLKAKKSKLAIDLGAGHGIHTKALTKANYKVLAFEFDSHLHAELEENTKPFFVEIFQKDLRDFSRFVKQPAELIVCMGDTLCHLGSLTEVEILLDDVYKNLEEGGHFICSFRSYENELKGNERFIPVKNDEQRILTCFLEYRDDKVAVTDILVEKKGQAWVHKVSSYEKIRIGHEYFKEQLRVRNFSIQVDKFKNGMITIVAKK